ncbi:hypothetical protein HanXRQr2_Chr04g0167731 [Helianthus annuus]|uniref:Uncharacterized protein n=1 Tax=Helianthus annuus TaxID=4232 RepID=A0A9K3J7L3_HELAN|nr:hypothetical protein HanXRQr2_Chr04g0167731 [Helianthus annuus]KAJ0931414.1 hypothetical protein HanPSC8_Chr04g0161371 [Helianthus annuus]
MSHHIRVLSKLIAYVSLPRACVTPGLAGVNLFVFIDASQCSGKKFIIGLLFALACDFFFALLRRLLFGSFMCYGYFIGIL